MFPLDDADAGACEVELVLPVDAGKLRRLAADERDTGLAADLGRSLDELSDLLEVDPVRRDVVEEEERVGTAGQHVVDAMSRKVGATVRSAPRARASTSFVPTESVVAASSRVSSRGCRPANAPNPVAPVDSTAARKRSTIAPAFSSETPAPA